MRIFEALLLGSTLCAFAAGCDSLVVLETETDGETDPDPDPDPNPDPDPDPNPDAAFCETAGLAPGASETVAIAWDNEQVTFVAWNGTTKSVDPWGEPPPDDVNPAVTVAAGGGLVASSAVWSRFEPAVSRSFVRFYDETGAVVDTMDSDTSLTLQAIGADGTATLYEWDPDGTMSRQVVRLPDGRRVDFERAQAQGAPLEDGWLALQRYDAAGGTAGFALVHPASEEEINVPAPADSYPARTPRGLAFVRQGAPELVHVTPEGTLVHSLSRVAAAGPGFWLSTFSDSSTSLLHAEDGSRWVVDATTGALHSIEMTPPDGKRLLTDSCDLDAFHLTPSGGLLMPFRDDSVAQFYLFDVEAGAAVTVGLPIATPGYLAVGGRDGTHLIGSGDGLDTFCPIADWTAQPPADAVPTRSLQITRGETTHVLDLESPWGIPWSYPISRGGGCVAVPLLEGELEVLDVSTGQRTEAPAKGSWLWL